MCVYVFCCNGAQAAWWFGFLGRNPNPEFWRFPKGPRPSRQDIEDAEFLLQLDPPIEYICVSFVQKGQDLQELIDIMEAQPGIGAGMAWPVAWPSPIFGGVVQPT